MNIYEYLTTANREQFKWLFETHLAWSAAEGRTAGNPVFHMEPGALNVGAIRCNDERDSNNGKWNDYLWMILNGENGEYTKVIIRVTTDPGKDRYGVAHLQQGVWNSYKIRCHNFASRVFPRVGYIGRWAICNDLDVVGVVRTDGKGNVIKTERGQFKINIHDRVGVDPSAGCTVIEDDNEYVDLFLPQIYDINEGAPVPVNGDNLTYCLINIGNLEKYIESAIPLVARAEAVSGLDSISNGAMAGTIDDGDIEHINSTGLQFIRDAESLRLTAYKDSGGVWTIGYGSTIVDGSPVMPGMAITKDKAEECLRSDVEKFEKAVAKFVTVKLNQNQFSALVSLCYNIGIGAFSGSTLVKVLNKSDYAGAADQILRWNKDNGKVVQGLVNRRKRERELFLKA